MGLSCPKRGGVEHSVPLHSLCGGGGKLVSKLTKKFVLHICFKYWQVAQLFVCMTGGQNLCCNVVLLSHPFKMFLLLGTLYKARFLPEENW